MTEPNVSPEDVVREALEPHTEECWSNFNDPTTPYCGKHEPNAAALTALRTLIAERDEARSLLGEVLKDPTLALGFATREFVFDEDGTRSEYTTKEHPWRTAARRALAAPDGSEPQ